MTTGEAHEFDCVVTLSVFPGEETEFEALLREMEAATIANDEGCVRYEWYRAETAHTYILLERWTNVAAVQAHLAAPHMVAILARIQGLAPERFTSVTLAKL